MPDEELPVPRDMGIATEAAARKAAKEKTAKAKAENEARAKEKAAEVEADQKARAAAAAKKAELNKAGASKSKEAANEVPSTPGAKADAKANRDRMSGKDQESPHVLLAKKKLQRQAVYEKQQAEGKLKRVQQSLKQAALHPVSEEGSEQGSDDGGSEQGSDDGGGADQVLSTEHVVT